MRLLFASLLLVYHFFLLTGFVQDQTGNSNILFMFLGVMSMIGLALISTMVIIFKRRQPVKTFDSNATEDHQRDETEGL